LISGAHMIVYSKDAEADRTFFRDVLGLASVDAGHGWLIFALPPAEVAFHPAGDNGRHEIYLMCDDVASTISQLDAKGVQCDPVKDQGWGLLTSLALPGGGKLGLYQPRHLLAHSTRST
jgi:catechol 2,3-dioxygenase-like lactoylglutathione lyase family enzyme